MLLLTAWHRRTDGLTSGARLMQLRYAGARRQRGSRHGGEEEQEGSPCQGPGRSGKPKSTASSTKRLRTPRQHLLEDEERSHEHDNRHEAEELGQLSSDPHKLLVATDIATLFLDRELRILRFTPKIEQLFNVRFSDRGRSLADFTSRIGYDDLCADARQVLERLMPIERETEDDRGRWCLSRVLPYRSQDDRIEGVVITFVEITRQKEAERSVQQAKDMSERILDTLPVPLLILRGHEIVSANDAYYRAFGVTAGETEGCSLLEVLDGQWAIPDLIRVLNEAPDAQGRFEEIEVDRSFGHLGRRVLVLKARRLEGEDLVLLGLHDITQRCEADEQVRASQGKLAEQLSARDEYLAMLGHELRNPLGAIRSATELLKTHETDDPSLRRTYDVLNRQALHMSRIIDGLLDISNLSTFVAWEPRCTG